MAITGFKNHPYIPNSVPAVEDAMLKELGLKSIDELHAEVPTSIKLKKPLNIPAAFGSEQELRRHVEDLLKQNKNCNDNLCFLGAGCWPHYVPAICDEVNSRGEFLTGYGGEPYNDFGRFQTLFEYQSLVAELVDMEVVNVPTMDWSQAASTAIRMGARINGRSQVLVPRLMDGEKLAVIKNYCSPDLELIPVEYEKDGSLSLKDLKAKLSDKTAVVYIENPTFLGHIEAQGTEISELAHQAGAIMIVGVDPISLGVLTPPVSYGADIVCGDLQPLGIHMNYGGGQAGFMATMDEEKFVMEFPSRLFGIAPTTVAGEYGFGDVAYDRTSFGHLRENGKEYVGTQAGLWGITAGVYLAVMGPQGMQEVCQTIMQRSQYAVKKLNTIKGVKANSFDSAFFKEFVVDFSATGKKVSDINKKLVKKGVFGGKDLSHDFPQLGQSALYCVTEVHTKEDIDTLVSAIAEIVG